MLLVVVWTAVVLAVDIATKRWAASCLTWGEPLAVGPIDLHVIYNPGAAFGLLPGWQPVFIATSIVVIGVVAVYGFTATDRLVRTAAGLIAGGSAGNLVDRLMYGAVIDFIDVKIWPVFNVADAAILSGLVLMVWSFTRPGERRGSQCDQ